MTKRAQIIVIVCAVAVIVGALIFVVASGISFF
jgi:hypothetical protein